MKYMKQLVKKIVMLALVFSLMTPAVSVSMPATEVQAASTFKLTVTASSDYDVCAKKVYDAIMRGQRIVVTEKNNYGSDAFYIMFYTLQTYININWNMDQTTTSIFVFHDYVTEKDIGENGVKYIISAKKAAKLAAASKTAKAGIAAALSSSSSTAEIETAAQSIHEALMGKSAYIVYVKGSDNVKSVYKKLKAKVQKINNQGVIFDYFNQTAVPGTDDIYAINISEKYAKEYYWMVKLSAKILEVAQSNIANGKVSNIYIKESTTAGKLILEAEGMADLSDIVKLAAVDASYLFNTTNSNGGIGMRYTFASKTNTSSAKTVDLLKALYAGTATGVCEQFARAEVIVFGEWDIDVNYTATTNHAWTKGTAANADGKMISYSFN